MQRMDEKIVSENDKTCSTGLTQEVSVLLSYIFLWMGGVVFLLIETRNQVVRFHAMQSVVLNVSASVLLIALKILSFIPLLGLVFGLASVLGVIGLMVLTVFIITKNFDGESVRLPLIGDLAEKWLGRF